MYSRYVKRGLDFVIALGAIVVLLVPMVVIALFILADDFGPVFFVQKRFGREKKFFKIVKFRTMKMDTPDVPTDKMKNPEQYVTRVGRFLRKTSLDELPQLFNILVGQMSLVGPRPALWNQERLIKLRDKNGANALRPGLTGWAQINGRDDLPESKKAKLDGEYAAKASFGFDCKCFFGTFVKVARGEGVDG